MRLHTIAVKNILRRKSRMALVVVGLAVGVATLVSIVTLVLAFQKNIDTQLGAHGFNIVVYPASSSLSLNYGGMNISGVDTYEVTTLTEKDVAKIKSMPTADTLRVVSPKIVQAVDVDGKGGKKALLVGVDFKQEFKAKRWWEVAGEKPLGRDEVVLGKEAAEALKVKAGETLQVSGREFTVAGILMDTGSQDDGLIFADIREAQRLFGRSGEVSMIEISTKGSASIDETVRSLETLLPGAAVSSVKQVVEYKEKAVGSLAKFGLMITMLIILISGLVVFMTMSSSVNERKREIGIFRAIGYRSSSVARIVLTEALLLSLVGGVVGYVAGFAIVYALPYIVAKFDLVAQVNFVVLLIAIGLSVITGLTSSVIPARRAAGMDPADALKSL